MIKKSISLFLVFLFIFLANSFGATNPVDLIKQMNEENLKAYVRPLITSFGTATGSGLYHTASTHGLLGLDVGLKIMWVPIPEDAKTFEAKILKISLTDIDTTYRTTATIFGESGTDTISVPIGSYAIPPVLPGGLNLPGIPFFMPQLNVGLIQGTELMIRYIPIPFKGSDVQIFGAGLKIGLNDLLNLKLLPVNIAAQGAYQVFNIGDIIKSSTISANIHVSKTFLMLTPYVGLGYENTKMNFDYTFKYQIPGQPQSTEVPVEVSINGENSFRTVIGLAFKFGMFLVHGDYNITKYPSFNGGVAFSLR
ncbi:MAG: DUF6588 family protein [bacterium]